MPSSSLSWILEPSSPPAPPPIPAEESYVSVVPQLTGYVLEPPRVGGANSPFTLTPNVVISNQSAFDAAYPTDESAPRTEYLAQVLREGTLGTGPEGALVLPDATFAWTKNEGVVQEGLQVPFQRFDYAGQDQRFQMLRGAPRELVGIMTGDANTNRLVVSSVPQIEDLVAFRVRVSVGSTGSGVTLDVSLVDSFGSPPFGTVEMDTTGALNWNSANITGSVGAPVYFQRQGFYKPNETDGVIGALGSNLWLNPLPSTGQLPAIRVGERAHLTPIQRATEGAFSSNPSPGTVEWAVNTGRLKFNATDVAGLSGQPVYYDGVFFGFFQVPTAVVGLAQATPCGTLATLPSESSDVYFRISGEVQFTETAFVDTFDATGKKGQVQIRRGDRAVQLSAADRAEYSGLFVHAVLPDVHIERGVSLRLFRSPVNPSGEAGVKDVTATYAVQDATLAEPIVGQPFVFLPALPREDEALTVRVEQGTGSFVGSLARLDVASPPTGKGYALDIEARQLSYVERKSEILEAPAAAFSELQLPGAPVKATALLLEIESTPGAGDFAPQVENRDFTIDLGSGVVTEIATQGYVLLAGTATSVSGSTLQVPENLVTAGVEPGDIVITQDPVAGVYTVVSVAASTATVSPSFPTASSAVPYEIRRGKEVLVDRFFREVPPVDPNTRIERIRSLGTISNGPRLRINPAFADRVRFRFGKTTFSASVYVTDSGFTSDFMGSGEVEIDKFTGEIHFSEIDVTAGGTVYCAQTLLPGVDYRLQSALGFVEFAERMVEREEVLLHYVTIEDDGTKTPVDEPGAFLIPKERVQAHPTPTSVLSFNPAGRQVAVTPSPTAFRGGRPQSASRVAFDIDASTVTFLPDSQVTDALPHGPIVGPAENVYVDYYVVEALGGENNLTVARPPIATPQIGTLPPDPEAPHVGFTIEGDRTAEFQAGLLEVDGSEVYLISGSSFNGTVTAVNLDQTEPQYLRSDLSSLTTFRVTSGIVRRFSTGVAAPSYFVTEDAGYDVVARGSKQIRLIGDQSRFYAAGTIAAFSAVGYQEYYKVEGATFDADTQRTVVVLSSGTVRQYAAPVALLRSVRPIFGSSAASAVTNDPPILTLPVTVYRQTEGQPGEVLREEEHYTIDSAGRVTFTEPLGSNEELGILYSGVQRLDAGRRTRASWTFALVPDADNGLADQILQMDYTTYAPDTFFWRVETISNFRAEMVQELEDTSKAASPSQGPILENSAETPLHEQGNPSLFFDEGDLANQDLVARWTLQFYNTAINSLESYFEGWDGRVVGDHDGRFLFDGKTNNPVRTHFAYATNQIDDLIQVFGSTTKRAFEAATYSRFYPTQKSKFGAAEDPTGLATGDPILDLQEKALKTVTSVKTRAPWAVTTAAAAIGATVLQVDHAQGDAYLLRPGLNVVLGLKVAITTRDGASLVSDSSPATVASTTPTSVTLSAPLAVAVPKGSTVRMASQDDVYRQVFTLGVDVGVDVDSGFLTHVANDDVPLIFMPNSNPTAGMPLDVIVQVVPTNTAPARFPALDGGTTDDDGGRQFPALSVGRGEEGAIADELALIDAATGTLEAIVTPSLTSSGTVTSADTIDRGAAWSIPAPKVGDLVRITSGGTAGTSDYHRITAVGGATITIEPDLEFASGAVTFEVTRGPVVTSGSGTVSPTTVLTNAGGNFVVNGVKPGFTVVAVSGALLGQRRQVTAVTATQLTVDSAFSATGAVGYEVVNSLATYGGPASSLQDDWALALTEQLRALEGQDLIDFSERIVAQQTGAQVITVSGVNMGAFSTLLVFCSVEQTTDSSLASVTFGGTPLTAIHTTAGAQNLGLHVYLGQTLSGSGNLVVTAMSATADMKVFALKLSAMRQVSAVATASTTSVPATVGTSGLSSVEAGDLIVSFVCCSAASNRFHSMGAYETLIPRFGGNSTSAFLTASRATAPGQAVTKDFRVTGTSATTRVATVVLTKDPSADMIVGYPVPERVALSRFIESSASSDLLPSDALDEAAAALEAVEAAIVGTGTLRLLHECPITVYRNASTEDSSFTSASGRLVLGGARARPIAGLTARETALESRAANSVQGLQDVLSSERLYDGRFVWIDSRINLETGILPKKDRAVVNQQRALETTVKNLTKLLAMGE